MKHSQKEKHFFSQARDDKAPAGRVLMSIHDLLLQDLSSVSGNKGLLLHFMTTALIKRITVTLSAQIE